MKKQLTIILTLVMTALIAFSASAAGLAPAAVRGPRTILPAPGTSTLIVTDEETGLPVAGAKYDLFRVSHFGGPDTKIASAVTDQNGRITDSHTTTGSFYWTSAAEVEGYAADEEKHAFTVIGMSFSTTAIALVKPPKPVPRFSEAEKEWYDAYLEEMTRFASENPEARFGFIHLNDDEIPELVCSARLQESILPIDRTIEWIYVYTIRGGKAEPVMFCATGPFEYVSRTGQFRYAHEYAAFGPTMYCYMDMDHALTTGTNFGYGPLEEDGDTVSVIGFPNPDDVTGGWSERKLSQNEYRDLLKVYFPVWKS